MREGWRGFKRAHVQFIELLRGHGCGLACGGEGDWSLERIEKPERYIGVGVIFVEFLNEIFCILFALESGNREVVVDLKSFNPMNLEYYINLLCHV